MKKLNLTQWIFIALLLGIGIGAWLNVQFPATPSLTKSEAWSKVVPLLGDKTEPNRDTQLKAIAADSSLSAEEKYSAALKIAQGHSESSLSEQVIKASNRESKMNPTLEKILEIFSIFTEVFLRLIKMIIAPLVFATLVAGVAKLGDLKAVGRIGGKTLLWFMTASLISLALGAVLVNLVS